MKKGYIKLLIFELLILFVLMVNSFIVTFLSQLGTCIFLGIILILFKYIFGLERDRHRYIKDIILDIEKQILSGKILNEKEVIEKYILDNYKK